MPPARIMRAACLTFQLFKLNDHHTAKPREAAGCNVASQLHHSSAQTPAGSSFDFGASLLASTLFGSCFQVVHQSLRRFDISYGQHLLGELACTLCARRADDATRHDMRAGIHTLGA